MKYTITLKEDNLWVAQEFDNEGTEIASSNSNTPAQALQNLRDRDKTQNIHNTIRYHTNNFFDRLEESDISKISFSTEIYMSVDGDGATKHKGNEYMAVVCCKHNPIPEGAVLQSGMPYPSKVVFDSFAIAEQEAKKQCNKE